MNAVNGEIDRMIQAVWARRISEEAAPPADTGTAG
jgi:hypothetical protein